MSCLNQKIKKNTTGLLLFVFLANIFGSWAHFSLIGHLYCPIHQQMEHVDSNGSESILADEIGHAPGWHHAVATDDPDKACDEHFFPTDKFLLIMPPGIQLLSDVNVSPIELHYLAILGREILAFAPKSSPPALRLS
jgi:hypothetical protein